jgi:hypothetical protein
MLLPFMFDGYGLGIAQERDPEEGRTVTNLGRSPSGCKTVTTFLVDREFSPTPW